MNLSLFCNLYIIAEYLRLKRILDVMPRYRVGTHRGNIVIREYSGSCSNLTKLETRMNTKSFAEAQRNLEKYDSCIRAKKFFCEEISRRHLAVPENFRFVRERSRFNVAYCGVRRCLVRTRSIAIRNTMTITVSMSGPGAR